LAIFKLLVDYYHSIGNITLLVWWSGKTASSLKVDSECPDVLLSSVQESANSDVIPLGLVYDYIVLYMPLLL